MTFPDACTVAPVVLVTPRSESCTSCDNTCSATIHRVSTTQCVVNIRRLDMPGRRRGQQLQLNKVAIP